MESYLLRNLKEPALKDLVMDHINSLEHKEKFQPSLDLINGIQVKMIERGFHSILNESVNKTIFYRVPGDIENYTIGVRELVVIKYGSKINLGDRVRATTTYIVKCYNRIDKHFYHRVFGF